MLAALLKKYSNQRKEKYFQSPLFNTQKKYAFIGVGSHSLANFYPLLRHFNISLKYICTRSSDWSTRLSPLFPGCTFTNDPEDIIRDKEVAGVFVCAAPQAHYSLLSRLMTAGKDTFVEKPPCSSLEELQRLLQVGGAAICKVGLQRRYWPGNKQAVRHCRTAASYIYQFQTGPYPQGDPFTELFIHPLDYCRFLFGDYSLRSFSTHKDDTGVTLQLHVGHANGISGLLQLSTHHSWHPTYESMQVDTKSQTVTIQYPGAVTGRLFPRRILNIPAERLLQQPAIIKEYYNAGPSMVPALDLNTLLTQGFYHELSAFIALVEGRAPADTPKNDLSSLLNVYEILQQLKTGTQPPTTSL